MTNGGTVTTTVPGMTSKPIVTVASRGIDSPAVTCPVNTTNIPANTISPSAPAVSPKPTVDPNFLAALPTEDPGKDDGWIHGWY